jgi:hypothetical protein
VQVPTKTLSAFAPMSDISTAKANTKASTITEVTFLLISVRNRRMMGMRRTATARQMATIWAKKEILVLEKK